MEHPQNLEEENARLREELERLKTKPPRGLTYRVSEKGGLSVYGLGRFPVTLYREQWTRLLAEKEAILDFIAAHEGSLKVKE